jgi:THO complex subunit 1
MSGEGGRGPTLLRLCNTLLRRLSKAEDTIFAGRILIYLSQSFPLCERSGMNIRGEFHTDNVTEYDKDVTPVKKEPSASETPAAEDESMTDATAQPDDKLALPSSDSKTAAKKKEEEEDIDLDTLYPIFWNLQSYFSDPSKLFEKEENFEEFKTGLVLTLNKFKKIGNSNSKSSDHEHYKPPPSTPSLTAALPVGSKSEPSLADKRKRESETTSEHFNPKYLTGRELFELEITDLTFQRHILVQAIILIDYLLTLTPSSKEFYTSSPLYPRLSTLNIGTLEAANETWCLSMKSQISTYLSPDRDGSLFMRTVETILQRDKNWTRWKMKGGKSFERTPISQTDLDLVIYNAKAATTPMPKYPHLMGTPALSRLWRDSATNPGLAGLKGRIRNTLPTPASFVPKIQADLMEIAAPFSDEDFEAAVEGKNLKMWRAMRLASRDSYALFNRIEDKLNEWRAKERERLKKKAEEEGTEWRGSEEKVEERDDLKALLEIEEEEKERRKKAKEERERKKREGTPEVGKMTEEDKGVGLLSPRKRHLEVVQGEEGGDVKRLRSTTPGGGEAEKEVEMVDVPEANKVEENKEDASTEAKPKETETKEVEMGT